VQPEWFRRGAGRALMSDLEGWLRIRGVPQACIASTRSGAAFIDIWAIAIQRHPPAIRACTA
jgi:GNAT superfamily N-acetyltransferase